MRVFSIVNEAFLERPVPCIAGVTLIRCLLLGASTHAAPDQRLAMPVSQAVPRQW